MTDLQTGHFPTDGGWRELIDSTRSHLKRDSRSRYGFKAGPARPGHVVSLVSGARSSVPGQHVEQTVARCGMTSSQVDCLGQPLSTIDVIVVEEVASASPAFPVRTGAGMPGTRTAAGIIAGSFSAARSKGSSFGRFSAMAFASSVRSGARSAGVSDLTAISQRVI